MGEELDAFQRVSFKAAATEYLRQQTPLGTNALVLHALCTCIMYTTYTDASFIPPYGFELPEAILTLIY